MVDVVVVGGGISGTLCSIYLGRKGHSVLLIDRAQQVGGLATLGLVNPFMQYWNEKGSLIHGVFEELLLSLEELGGSLRNCFDAQVFRVLLYDRLKAANVKLLLNTQIFDVDCEGQKINRIHTIHGTGVRQKIPARFFVDATGDGVLSFLAGAQYQQGDDQGINQACTTMFTMGGVDFEAIREHVARDPENFFGWVSPEMNVISVAGYFQEIRDAAGEGYQLPQDYFFFVQLPGEGRITVNTTHYGVNTTDPWAISEATMVTNAQAFELVRFSRKKIPGFQKAYLENLAPMLGVRESRRVMGKEVFRGEDVIHGRSHPDGVIRAVYGIDVHRKTPGTSKKERKEVPQNTRFYEIPLGSMVVKGFCNLGVIGRCFSSDFLGQSAARIMPTCGAMGEVMGHALSMAIHRSSWLTEISGSEVREEMGWY